MKIDRNLNLIIPIYSDELVPKLGSDGKPVIGDDGPETYQPIRAYVHAVPLLTEVVDRYFMILAQTYSAIFGRGLGIMAGPSVAARLLQQVAIENKVWADGPDFIGVEKGLMEDVRRTTNVILTMPGTAGWQQVPLHVAADRGFIDAEDKSEVENAIVFFIVGSATLNRVMRRPILEAACGIWGAQMSSLDCTAFMSSLRTSTGTVSSGGTSPAPAKPVGGPANAIVDGRPSSIPV